MNLNELQAFLEDSNWDEDPEPAHPNDAVTSTPVPTLDVPIPKRKAEIEPQSAAPSALATPVKLVPRSKEAHFHTEPELRGAESVRERLMEVEIAQKMGYLLCKCTWPPQIMVLTSTDHIYHCRRCSRVREI